MATLNERGQLRENRVVADDLDRRGLGIFSYGLILVLALAILPAWFAFGTGTPTVNNSPSITAPATSPPTPTAIPERQPPTSP